MISIFNLSCTMRIFSASISKQQLVAYLIGFMPFVYFECYLNMFKWCLDRPNHQRTMSEPPTGLLGCMYDRFQEITLTLVGLFWIVLFFSTYILVKKSSKPGTIIFTFVCCYVIGVIAFWLISGLLSYG